jgi:hypothetical protein
VVGEPLHERVGGCLGTAHDEGEGLADAAGLGNLVGVDIDGVGARFGGGEFDELDVVCVVEGAVVVGVVDGARGGRYGQVEVVDEGLGGTRGAGVVLPGESDDVFAGVGLADDDVGS